MTHLHLAVKQVTWNLTTGVFVSLLLIIHHNISQWGLISYIQPDLSPYIVWWINRNDHCSIVQFQTDMRLQYPGSWIVFTWVASFCVILITCIRSSFTEKRKIDLFNWRKFKNINFKWMYTSWIWRRKFHTRNGWQLTQEPLYWSKRN